MGERIGAQASSRSGHLAQIIGADLMPEAARAAVNADDNGVGFEPEAARDLRVVNLRDALHLEIMVARPERSHLIALALLRLVGHGGWIGARHRAMLLDALEVLDPAVADLQCPARATGKHRVGVFWREPQRAGAAESRRDALVERVGELALHAAQLFGFEAGEKRAHAAGNVEADATRGDHAAVIGIERGDAADRKAVAPVRVGHRERRLDDARQRGDVGNLLGDLIVHRADQCLVGVDHAGNAHLSRARQLPLALASTVQSCTVH